VSTIVDDEFNRFYFSVVADCSIAERKFYKNIYHFFNAKSTFDHINTRVYGQVCVELRVSGHICVAYVADGVG